MQFEHQMMTVLCVMMAAWGLVGRWGWVGEGSIGLYNGLFCGLLANIGGWVSGCTAAEEHLRCWWTALDCVCLNC
jgi:hypothetical protein